MAIVVQDDFGEVANANSYIDVAYYDSYMTSRGYDVSGQSVSDKEAGLLNATDYIDVRFSYVGEKTNGDEQTTEIPRSYEKTTSSGVSGCYHTYCCTTYETYNTGIPEQVKQAQAHYAYEWITGGKHLENSFSKDASTVKRTKSKVDVIEKEIEYDNNKNNSSSYPIYQKPDNLMKKSGVVINCRRTARA